MGSVSDLTAVQSDESQAEAATTTSKAEGTEEVEQGKSDNNKTNQRQNQVSSQGSVEITVTSPKGTVREAGGQGDGEEEQVTQDTSAENGAAFQTPPGEAEEAAPKEEFVNSQGVTFTPTTDMVDESGSLVPYGLPCVRELFRFLVSLINPHDPHNQDSMIQIALSLLATTLETGADSLDKFESLLGLVKDDLSRNLVSLLSAERIATFSMTLWLSYVVIESQRRHLKYQLEIFLGKLNDVVCSYVTF